MTCPKCKYEWCWLCGAVYYSGHFDVCGYKNVQKKNPPWSIVLACAFASAVVPFIVCVVAVYIMESALDEPNFQPHCLRRFFGMKKVAYPVMMLLALILTPLVLALSPVVGGIFLVHEAFLTIDNYY